MFNKLILAGLCAIVLGNLGIANAASNCPYLPRTAADRVECSNELATSLLSDVPFQNFTAAARLSYSLQCEPLAAGQISYQLKSNDAIGDYI